MADKSATTSSLSNYLKLKNFGEEYKAIQNYFSLTTWQFLVIIGIAVSGIAAFINTYNMWTNINANWNACANSGALKKELQIQFIVLLVVSIVAILIGILLAALFRHSKNPRRLVTLGIVTAGILGTVYAISMKFQNSSNAVKLGISWFAFLAFIILGIFMSTGYTITETKTTKVKKE